MELTAFKTMPEELIRLIMAYARPTYVYMNELKWVISRHVEHKSRVLAILPDYTQHLSLAYTVRSTTWNTIQYRIYGEKFYEPEFRKMFDMKYKAINVMENLGILATESLEDETNAYDTIYEEMIDIINWYNGVLPVY